MAKEEHQTRNMGGGRRASGAAGSYKAKNYLFAIAINDYEHIDKLHNCVRDAEAVIELLTEDFEFEREEVCFVCSGHLHPSFQDVAVLEETADGSAKAAKATRSVILKELRRIARSIEKDQQEDPELKVNLLLYYSGHGWYDDFLDQGYWIPVDSELDDYSKYISNSTIRDFLSGINTHHTLLLSDSCFSGSLFASGTGKSLASTRLEKDPSRWGITAGRNEVVSDGEVGKQSPFIDSFLTELRAADTISVQDLSTKILERVASNDKQTPRGEPLRVRGHKGGQFVFRKKANAERHYDAGHLILRLARHQPEYARFRAAANQFGMAGRLTKKKEDQARYLLWEVRSLSYAGLFDEAIATYDKERKGLNADQDTPALKEQVNALRLLRAPGLLKENLAKNPFSPSGTWLRKLSTIHNAKNPERKDCHLFQVAINEFEAPNMPRLSGCINDSEIIKETLQETFGAERFSTKRLYDEEATHSNIIQSLESLQKKVHKSDWVFVQFSGIVVDSPDVEQNEEEDFPFIASFDLARVESENKQQNKEYLNAVGHRELHDLLEGIPCWNKVIILDTDHHDAFRELAEKGSYTLLLAADKGERARETRVNNNQTHGLFSYALSQVMTEKHKSSSVRKPLRIKKFVEERAQDQHPVFIQAEGFFDTVSSLSIPAEASINFLLQAFYGSRNPDTVLVGEELISTINKLDLSFSAAQWQRLAELLPTNSDNAQRISYYEKSLTIYQAEEPTKNRSALLGLHLQLANLYASNGHLQTGEQHLWQAKEYLLDGDKVNQNLIKKNLHHFKRLARKKKYALLVAVGEYELPAQADEVRSGLEEWQNTLLSLGYEKQNITVLQDGSATRSEILKHFTKLAKKVATNSTFFFFYGKGQIREAEKEQSHYLYAYDSDKKEEDTLLSLSALKELSASARHFTVVLDVGFVDGEKRKFDFGKEEESLTKPLLGNTLILPGVEEEASGDLIHQHHNKKGSKVGALTVLLNQRLQQGKTRNVRGLVVPDVPPSVTLEGTWLPKGKDKPPPPVQQMDNIATR